MREEIIYSIASLYRDDFRIRGYRFGSGHKSLCIVGGVRGNEYQQIFTCSQVVQALKQAEAEGELCPDHEILVIPTLNPSSMNIGKRFWPTDNTDINRMFPGYDLGETTQRIAAGVFQEISQYDMGIQFASFYMPGQFSAHVRMMKTGFENVDKARQFGLPYVVLRNPKPYDTTTLNYNWQIWETDAYSLYTTVTTRLDEHSAGEMVKCVLRFMAANGIIDHPLEAIPVSRVIRDEELLSVRPHSSGLLRPCTRVDAHVCKGEELAWLQNPCDGERLETLTAPADGTVFFLHDDPLVYAATAAIKLIPDI